MDNLVSKKLIYILKYFLKVSKLDLDTYLSFEGSILFCTFVALELFIYFIIHSKMYIYIINILLQPFLS